MACCQDILGNPRRGPAPRQPGHLTVEQIRLLLAQPDRSTRQGRRDANLRATRYDTGARVQEPADLAVRDIRMEPPALVALAGEGRTTGHVPLAGNTVTRLHSYLTGGSSSTRPPQRTGTRSRPVRLVGSLERRPQAVSST